MCSRTWLEEHPSIPLARCRCPQHLGQLPRFVGAQPETFARGQGDFHRFPARDVIEPAVRGAMDAPAVQPGIAHRPDLDDLGQRDALADQADAEAEDQVVGIDLDGQFVEQQSHDAHHDRSTEDEHSILIGQAEAGQHHGGRCQRADDDRAELGMAVTRVGPHGMAPGQFDSRFSVHDIRLAWFHPLAILGVDCGPRQRRTRREELDHFLFQGGAGLFQDGRRRGLSHAWIRRLMRGAILIADVIKFFPAQQITQRRHSNSHFGRFSSIY